MKTSSHPRVILAGAGPGEVGLIAVKTAEYLSKADYILTDRLVNPEILERYAAPHAQIIYVGKHGGRASVSQEAINELLVAYGLNDNLTIRLKGGDVAFFSNVLSEIEALQAYHIPFEIVPGITAASGASASLQMPLTARGLSQGVRLLSFATGAHFTESEWRNMAETTDTLVFYMSGKTLPELVAHLRLYATDDKHLAVVEQATTQHQRVLTASLFSFDTILADVTIQQPALVVIGAVACLCSCCCSPQNAPIPFFKQH